MSRKLFQYQQGELFFSNQKISSYLTNYQQPIWLYQKQLVQQRIQWIQQWKRLGRLHYAIKANFEPEILKVMLDNNCGIDAVSLGEMQQALNCGFKPADIILSGVAKTEKELKWAIENEIYQINVENISELKKIIRIANELKKQAHIGLRLNPEVDAETHPGIATALKDSKFGLDFESAEIALTMIQQQNFVVLKAISFHIGSQILNVQVFEKAIQTIKPFYLKAQAVHKNLDRLDLGGGLGINYHEADSFEDQNRWLELQKIYERELQDLNAFFILEMGRFLVARSCVLLTRVEVVKQTASKNFLMLDAGMSLLMRPALYKAFHQILPIQLNSEKKMNYSIVGPICESSDVLADHHEMTEVHEGDFLAICDVGAYGASMSSNYNLREPAINLFILAP